MPGHQMSAKHDKQRAAAIRPRCMLVLVVLIFAACGVVSVAAAAPHALAASGLPGEQAAFEPGPPAPPACQHDSGAHHPPALVAESRNNAFSADDDGGAPVSLPPRPAETTFQTPSQVSLAAPGGEWHSPIYLSTRRLRL